MTSVNTSTPAPANQPTRFPHAANPMPACTAGGTGAVLSTDEACVMWNGTEPGEVSVTLIVVGFPSVPTIGAFVRRPVQLVAPG